MTMLRRTVCSVLLAATAAPLLAMAQELPLRMFPPAVKYATLRVSPNFEATLNKDPARLSPGVRIFTPQNMMVLPNMVVNQPVKVAYVLDIQGFVQQAWILSDKEASNVKVESKGFFSFMSSPFQ